MVNFNTRDRELRICLSPDVLDFGLLYYCDYTVSVALFSTFLPTSISHSQFSIA